MKEARVGSSKSAVSNSSRLLPVIIVAVVGNLRAQLMEQKVSCYFWLLIIFKMKNQQIYNYDVNVGLH